jgi:AcrR family transcriptional regulator
MTSTGQARRGYDASGRRAQAQATRERILDNARELFVSQGYAGTSIAQIAAASGVSAPTVFTGFRSKVNLLRAAVETAIVGDDEPVALAERPAMRHVHAGATAQEVLTRYAAMFVDIAPRACPISLVVYHAADADPEIAALAAVLDEQRLRGSEAIARTVVDRLGAPDRLEDVRDTVWTLNAPLLYGLLVDQRGWSIERYADWARRGLLALAT